MSEERKEERGSEGKYSQIPPIYPSSLGTRILGVIGEALSFQAWPVANRFKVKILYIRLDST